VSNELDDADRRAFERNRDYIVAFAGVAALIIGLYGVDHHIEYAGWSIFIGVALLFGRFA